MGYDPSLCKCPGCPWHNTNSCLYEQAEAQVKELLRERNLLKEALAYRRHTKESPGTASNKTHPAIARRIELLLEEWDEYEPNQKAVLADILSELQQASA